MSYLMTAGVAAFQIAILFTICIAGFTGRKPLVLISAGWVVFTLFGSIFTAALLLLQLITIFIAYSIGSSIAAKQILHQQRQNSVRTDDRIKNTKGNDAANDDEKLHFLHVLLLCGVGGWLLALAMARGNDTNHHDRAFIDLLTDTSFIGMAAAPASALLVAAAIGWAVGKAVAPLRLYASWIALAFSFGLFLALKFGGDIRTARLDGAINSPEARSAKPSATKVDAFKSTPRASLKKRRDNDDSSSSLATTESIDDMPIAMAQCNRHKEQSIMRKLD